MGKSLINPPALQQGDTIGVAAPASPFDEASFKQGVHILESMGFVVKVTEEIFKKDGYLAGSDQERAGLLMALFEDTAIRAIFCARGGFGSMKILPFLDFKTIADNPKILVGFSDITALALAIYDRSNMTSLHGPLVTTLKQGSPKTVAELKSALSALRPPVLKPSIPRVLHPGQATGPVLGGNLATLTHLMGTPYEPSLDGALLFLEDRGEPLYRIDRMLSQLRLAGRLDAVSGLILGTFEDCGHPDDVYHLFSQTFSDKNLPILGGFDFGHGPENVALPIGPEATLDTDEQNLRFRESALSEADGS